MAFFTGLFSIIGLIILFVFVLGASLLSGISRFIFGSKRRSSFGGDAYNHKQGQQSQQRQETQSNQTSENANDHHKVFSPNEGDYVDFEEIDED